MLDLLQQMIQLKTVNPPGNERKLAELICDTAVSHGLEATCHHVEPNRSNVTVMLRGNDSTRKKLYFSGHLDTVPIGDQPWTVDPFGGEIIDGKMYGRGTTDMKGGIAAFLETLFTLKEQHKTLEQDVVFIGTIGEEVDCLGAREAVAAELLENPGAIIIAEPSDLDLYIAHKGALWLEVSTYGKTAHGSMPTAGVNAVSSMLRFLDELQDLKSEMTDELLGVMTKSINTINGGIATNVVPDQCTVRLDFRTISREQNRQIVTSVEKILQDITGTLQDFEADYKVIQNLEPLTNPNDNAFIENLKILIPKDHPKQNANYYTDASIFRKHFDIPIVIYGAGEPTLAHQPDEWVSIKNLEKSVEFYLKTVDVYETINISKEKELLR